MASLPTALTAMRRRKMTPKTALVSGHKAPKDVKDIFKKIHAQPERYELNLYVSGKDEEQAGAADNDDIVEGGQAHGTPASSPAERSPNS
jgi:hypothetical protein